MSAVLSRRDLPALLRLARWLIPAVMAVLGLGYALMEFLWPGTVRDLPAHLLLSALLLGLVGPTLAWFTLTRALRTAEAHAVAEQQLRGRSRELAALNTFALNAAASLDLERILEAALEAAGQILGADSGRVYLAHPQTRAFELCACRGLSPQGAASEPTITPGFCLCGQALAHSTIALHGNIQTDSSVPGHVCREEGFRSVACVPLIGGERLLGVLQLASTQPNHFDGSQREFLSALALPLTIAVENARLYSQVRSFSESLEQRVAERTQALLAAQTALAEKTALLEQTLDRLRRLQEEERARIAQDLHDGVVQLVAGALLQAEAAREILEARPEVARTRLGDIQTLLVEIEAETRRAVFDLHPPGLGVHGLVSALRQLAAGYRERFDLKCSLNLPQTAVRLPPEVETVAYRILQEALHNAATHARATEVRINVDLGPAGVFASLADNGVGFDLPAVLAENKHLGLTGMIERARQAGGEVNIESVPGQGTRVRLRLPIHDSALPEDASLL